MVHDLPAAVSRRPTRSLPVLPSSTPPPVRQKRKEGEQQSAVLQFAKYNIFGVSQSRYKMSEYKPGQHSQPVQFGLRRTLTILNNEFNTTTNGSVRWQPKTLLMGEIRRIWAQVKHVRVRTEIAQLFKLTFVLKLWFGHIWFDLGELIW